MSRCIIISSVLFGLVSFQAKSQIDNELTRDLLVEIDELIVDQTLSKSGRDFYEIFYTGWLWPEVDQSFTIYIKERPARGNSTQIQVYVNDILVFESFLQPRYDALVELSQLTNRYVTRHIVSYEEILKQLQGDDMSGTGIF